MTATACTNCHKPLPGQAEFCPACGQSVKVITRPWHEVLGELVTELFDFDGRMFASLRLLVTRPGFLSYEYVNGRRSTYTSRLTGLHGGLHRHSTTYYLSGELAEIHAEIPGFVFSVPADYRGRD